MTIMWGGMTTREAVAKHQCAQCNEEGDGACGWDCVASSTCSLRCANCNERNWWTGSLPSSDEQWIFACVTCGRINSYNRAAGHRFRTYDKPILPYGGSSL